MSTINLRSYRFSAEELEKMQWLKKLFEDNGYAFDPNRFPEVYYDTFDRAAEIYTQLKDRTFIEDNTPDYLGVYLYTLEEQNVGSPCRISKEGIIILFEDRIERYADPVSVRFVVLMHELGHWLTHWAKDKNGLNWCCGYYKRTTIPDMHTHESLAQLIAYWFANGNPLNEHILRNHLTPKNPASPYRRYLKLTGISQSEILLKLKVIRTHMECNGFFEDESASAFLALDAIQAITLFAAEKSIFKHDLNEKHLGTMSLETILKALIMGKIAFEQNTSETTFHFPTDYDITICLMEDAKMLDGQAKRALQFNQKYYELFKKNITKP